MSGDVLGDGWVAAIYLACKNSLLKFLKFSQICLRLVQFFFSWPVVGFFSPRLTLLSLPALVKKSDKGFKNVYKNKYPPFSFQAIVTADNKSKVTCAHVETDEVFAVNLAARKLICHSDEHEHGDPSWHNVINVLNSNLCINLGGRGAEMGHTIMTSQTQLVFRNSAGIQLAWRRRM